MGRAKNLQPYIRIAPGNDKCLSISTGAGRYLVGRDEVNVYEKNGAMAMEGVRRGSYHIAVEKGRDRAMLCNKSLNLYVREKFGCEGGIYLPVWPGAQEGVIFFGGFQPPNAGQEILDESWRKVELDYNRRVGGWSYIHDNWIEFNQQILDGMAERLTVYESGGVTVLCPDEEGALELTARRQSGQRLLVSHALADFLREKYGASGTGCRLRAQSTPEGRVLLGDDEDKLTLADMERLTPVELDETELRFVTMGNRKGFYLSAQAWAAMGNALAVSAYAYGDWLALKPERRGEKRIAVSGYVKSFHSAMLTEYLRRVYPESDRLYLRAHGNLWLLQPQVELREDAPHPEQFYRLALNARKCQSEFGTAEQRREATEAKPKRQPDNSGNQQMSLGR